MTGIAIFAAALLLALGGNSIGRYTGWTVPRLEPADLSAKLAPFYRVTRPDGPGPFPTALLLSGCDGPKDNLDRWAAMLRSIGWASIVVDSHGPRGFSDYEIGACVCSGQLLMGSERAGDLLVAIDDARRMRFVDPDRIVLVGSSHGGWAIMDLLALDPPRRLPTNLARAPGRRPRRPAGRRRRRHPALPLLRPGEPRPPRALDPADPDAVRARRGRRDRALGLLPRGRRTPERRGTAGRGAALRRRHRRLRPADRSALSPLVFDAAATPRR